MNAAGIGMSPCSCKGGPIRPTDFAWYYHAGFPLAPDGFNRFVMGVLKDGRIAIGAPFEQPEMVAIVSQAAPAGARQTQEIVTYILLDTVARLLQRVSALEKQLAEKPASPPASPPAPQ